jgi:hypothetical protein
VASNLGWTAVLKPVIAVLNCGSIGTNGHSGHLPLAAGVEALLAFTGL